MQAFVLLVFLCISIDGCKGISSEEIRNVKGTIIKYNQLLAAGYAKMNMNELVQVATTEHATKVFNHMAALGEANRRMNSQLKKIDFLDLKFPKNNEALVNTVEVWDFVHTDITTNKKILEEKDFVYEITYVLIKDGDRWVIGSVTVVEEPKHKEKTRK